MPLNNNEEEFQKSLNQLSDLYESAKDFLNQLPQPFLDTKEEREYVELFKTLGAFRDQTAVYMKKKFLTDQN